VIITYLQVTGRPRCGQILIAMIADDALKKMLILRNMC